MSKRNVPNSPNSNPRAPKVPKALWSANVPPGPAREPALKDKANRKPTQSGMSQAAPKANSREAPVIEILDSSDKVPPVGDDSGALPGPTRAPPLKDKTNQGKSTGKSTRSGKATSEAKGKKKKVVGSDSSDEEPAAGDDYEDDGDDEVEKDEVKRKGRKAKHMAGFKLPAFRDIDMLSDSLMDKQANLLSLIIAKNHSKLKTATAEKEAAEFSIRALEIRMAYEETLSEQHLTLFRIEMAERASTEGGKMDESIELLRARVASLQLELSKAKEGEDAAEKSLEGVAEASTKVAE